MDKNDSVSPKDCTDDPDKQPKFWQKIAADRKARYAKIREYQCNYKAPISVRLRKIWRIFTYDFARDNSVIALFTALVFFGTIAYSYVAYLQWQAIGEGTHATQIAANAAKDAANTAARELELSERPWLSVNFSAVSPLVIDDSGLSINVKTTITNVGHSPAVKGIEQLKLYTSFLLRPEPWIVRDQVCREAERSSNSILSTSTPNSNVSPTQTWFLGEQPFEIYRLKIGREEIKKGMISASQVPKGAVPLPWYNINIAYCVAYYSSFGTKQYHTGYSLFVTRIKSLPSMLPLLPWDFSLENGSLPVVIIVGDPRIPIGPDAN